MASKRKAREAFGQPNGKLSAFAAARLAKQPKNVHVSAKTAVEVPAATVLAQVPYDGHHDDIVSDIESEDVEIVTAPPPKLATTSDFALSTCQLARATVTDQTTGSVTVTLRNDETLCCVGEYDLRVLEGVATVYGAVMHPNMGAQRVYAPSTQALPVITGRRNRTTIQLDHVKSTIRTLDRLSPLFRNIWTREDINRTFQPLQNISSDDLQRFVTPLEIDKAADAVLSRLSTDAESTARLNRFMAVGGKSSGKSTFNRILCNTLVSKPSLRRVLYLDLDPGQPEFGPPGLLSLVEVTAPVFGPPFTHPASVRSSQYKLLRSHAIAATSFKDDPAHYMACAQDLVQHADRRLPLVVNSCGWVSGLGASVLQDLAQTLGVTQIVVLHPLDPAVTEALHVSCSDATFHNLSRQPVRPTSRTPAESRAMQTMAYFHHRAKKADQVSRWTGNAMAGWRPRHVAYDGPQAGIEAVVSYGTNPHPDFLSEVLDGSIVALVRVDARQQDGAYGVARYTRNSASASGKNLFDLIERTQNGLPYMPTSSAGASVPLEPRHSECVGVALVRAIDSQSKTLQLVTPLSESQMAALMDQPIAIVRGSFDAPEWAYLEDVYSGGDGPENSSKIDRPWVSVAEAVGIEGAVWRLRHPPLAADVR
ncbi:Polynucleotide 5'-hydroxyl-kinase grc3 [Elasticomyces elasticus]|nr:Polynucleotide 5'-hydroxyl-kinase grc3 [Elasticomyces elasticus]